MVRAVLRLAQAMHMNFAHFSGDKGITFEGLNAQEVATAVRYQVPLIAHITDINLKQNSC